MINNNAKTALIDLLTYHKINTIEGFKSKLLAAINGASSLNITDIETYTKYSIVFNTFNGISFEQLFYFDRIKDSEYYDFLKKSYKELGFEEQKNNNQLLYIIDKEK